jgi:hypothetical protein
MASSLPTPPFSVPVLDGAFLSRTWQTWVQSVQTRLGGTNDNVAQALTTAQGAASASAEVVAGAGLQGGGAVGPNVGVALYAAVTSVALLPASAGEGDWAYALNGRKTGEAAGAGTGVPVFWSAGAWNAVSSAPVAA